MYAAHSVAGADVSASKMPPALAWAAHAAVWLLAGLAARLSRTGSMLELHITGRNDAELAPEHVRQILTAPTTEFKALSFIGVVAGLVLAVVLRTHGPRALGWFTLALSTICVVVYLVGYGIG